MLESLFNKVTGLQACNLTTKRLQHRRFPVNIANFRNTYFEKRLRRAASDSSHILYRKLNRIIQEPDWPFVSHSYAFVLSLSVIHCHSWSFLVTLFHLLSLVVIRCHLLYHSLSLVVILCTTRCHSLSLDVPLVCLFINDQC